MQNIIQTIVRARQSRRINILTCPTHERFESIFSKIDADFHSIETNKTKNWNENYAKMPSNYFIWKNKFPHHVEFDLVLSQNRFGQYQFLAPLAKQMNIPLICIEHTTVMPWWSEEHLHNISNMTGSLNIFICHDQIKKWNINGPSTVIGHCVDTNVFRDYGLERSGLLTVANDFINRDSVLNYKQFTRLTSGLNPTIVGNTPGLSNSQGIEEISKTYASHQVYLNTAHLSPIPTSLLEAMSSECAVVSCATCGIPEYVEHGKNGFLYNNEEDGRKYIELLLADKNLATKLGKAARSTIEEKCSQDQFIKSYQSVFESCLL